MKKLLILLALLSTPAQAQIPKFVSFDLPSARRCAETKPSMYDNRQRLLRKAVSADVYVCQIAVSAYEEGRRVFSLGSYTMATDFSVVGVK